MFHRYGHVLRAAAQVLWIAAAALAQTGCKCGSEPQHAARQPTDCQAAFELWWRNTDHRATEMRLEHLAAFSTHDALGEQRCAGFDAVVKKLAPSPSQLDRKDALGRTAAHNAVILGNLYFLKHLVTAGASINTTDKKGRTPLHDAIDLDVAQFLLDHGAKVNERDVYGMSPLFAVLATGVADLRHLKLFDKHGADFHLVDRSGRNALLLLLAAQKDVDKDAVGFLLDKKLDVNATDKRGNSPLQRAAQQLGGAEVTSLLLARGADVNALDTEGKTVLFKLVYHWGTRAVTRDQRPWFLRSVKSQIRHLVDAGLDINKKDRQGLTALNYANRRGFEAVASALVELGAEP
jgi:ankyrin repeat protein